MKKHIKFIVLVFALFLFYASIGDSFSIYREIETDTISLNISNQVGTYVITFLGNDGLPVSQQSDPITANTPIGTLPTATQDGYNFIGWYTAASGGTKITAGTLVTGNKTYYAHWAKLVCKKAAANTRHTETCVSDGSCATKGLYSANDVITYGNVVGANSPVSGDPYDCDVNDDGVYDAATERFYYVREIVDNSGNEPVGNGVFVHYTSFDADGQMDSSKSRGSYTYDLARTYLPTSSTWSNSALVSMNGNVTRFISREDLVEACGDAVLGSNGNSTFNNCQFFLETSRFQSSNLGRAGIWLEKENNQGYRIQTQTLIVGTANTSAGSSGSSNTARPVIQVPSNTVEGYVEKNLYTITLDLQGGTGVTSIQRYDGQKFGVVTEPTKAGSVFAGWYTAASGGTEVTANTVITGNDTYYARWISDITITFDADGGTVSPNTKTIAPGDPIGELPTPEKTGFTFAGWYTDNTWTTQVTSSTTFNTTTSIIAKWISNITITFDADGGTVSPNTRTIAIGSAIGELPTPEKTGFTFAGWYLDNTWTTQVTSTTTFNTTTSIIAKWISNITITFDADGGTVSPNTRTIASGSAIGELPTPEKTGFAFVGWYLDNTWITQVTSSTTFNATTSIIAKWEIASSITVTFDADGGTVSPASISATTGLALGELPTPEKANNIFLGWYTDNTWTTEVTSETVAGSSNMTVLARWADDTDVACIGATCYTSLALAVDDVPTTGVKTTIIVIQDIALSAEVEIPSTKNVELDLRTYTISVDSSTMFKNYGTLHIKNGTFVSTSPENGTTGFIVDNKQNAILNISGGFLNSTITNVMMNAGTVNITGGRLEANGSSAAVNNNQYGVMSVSAGELIGTSTTKGQAIYNNKGTLTISGTAYLENKSQTGSGSGRACVHNNAGTVNILGGTIISKANSAVKNNATMVIGTDDGTIDITSPVMQGYNYGLEIVSGKIVTIYDGIFKGKGTSNKAINDESATSHGTNTFTHDTETIGTDTYDVAYLVSPIASYTITFNANEGTVSPSSTTVTPGSAIGELPTPERTGYTFLGWYLDNTWTTEVTASTTFNSSTSIIAKWVENITITFDADGGTVSPNTRTIAQGGAIGELPTPEKIGYTFAGWYLDNTWATQVTSATTFNTTTSIVAKWISNITITFDADGGTVSPNTRTIASGSAIGELPTPEKTGFAFAGWYLNNTWTTQVTSSTTFNATTSIIAKWEETTDITITLNANDGSVDPTSITAISGQPIGEIPTPTKANSNFVGWYLDNTWTTEVTEEAIAGNSDIEIIARWVDDTYVACVGETCTYTTLAAAIAAVPTTGVKTTVKLLTDVTTTAAITISSDRNVDLNLQNFTISNSSSIMFQNDGTLHIKNGTIYSTYTNTSTGRAIYNNEGATLNISGGYLHATGTNVMENSGTVNITGGKLEANGQSAVINNVQHGVLTVSAGEIIGTNTTKGQAIYNNEGTLTISGTAYLKNKSQSGTTSGRACVHNFAGTVTILGGTIISEANAAVKNNDVMTIGSNDGVIDITSPVMQGSTYGLETVSGFTVTVYDGIFKGKGTTPNKAISNESLVNTGVATIVHDTETIGSNTYDIAYLVSSIASYTITFNANEGTVSPTSTTVTPGSAIGELPTPERTGYTFAGWYTDNTWTTEVTASTTFNSSTSIIAKWVENITVTFNANLGTVSPASKSFAPGAAIGELPTPERTGYTFLGWYTDNTWATEVTASTTFNSSTSMIAKWAENMTVTFDANTGVVGPQNTSTYTKTFTEAGPIGQLPTASKTNKEFLGWFTTASGGERVLTTTEVTANVTYYAHYTNDETVCRPATTLHSLSGTDVGQIPSGPTLSAGDAFDCDVNGDGTYDATNERFYYLTDDSNGNAVLILSNNTSQSNSNNGAPICGAAAVAYGSNGPTTAIGELPTTSQWSNVNIYSEPRTITNGTVTITNDFVYTGKAARFATVEEIKAATTSSLNGTANELASYTFLLENTSSQSSECRSNYWLETPYSATNIYRIDGKTGNKKLGNVSVSTGNSGVRPVIEVPYSSIEGVNDIVEFDTIPTAMRTYFDNISTWDAGQSDSSHSSFDTYMTNNLDTNKCVYFTGDNRETEVNYSNGFTNYCDLPNQYDTGVTGNINVYTYDVSTGTRGPLATYVTANNGKLYNMIPDQVYYWQSATDSSINGYVKPTGERRIISIDNTVPAGSKYKMRNVRDLGGIKVDTNGDGTIDGTIKYGKLFRGEKIWGGDGSTVQYLNKLGIYNEMDLRADSEVVTSNEDSLHKITSDPSNSNNKVFEIIHYGIDYTNNYSNYTLARNAATRVMYEFVKAHNDGDDDYSLLFHCRIGADRTGTLAYILEGLLGAPTEERYRDYELTVFFGLRERTRYYFNKGSNEVKFQYLKNAIRNAGDGTTEDVMTWFLKDGNTASVVDEDTLQTVNVNLPTLISDFRSIMIDSN